MHFLFKLYISKSNYQKCHSVRCWVNCWPLKSWKSCASVNEGVAIWVAVDDVDVDVDVAFGLRQAKSPESAPALAVVPSALFFKKHESGFLECVDHQLKALHSVLPEQWSAQSCQLATFSIGMSSKLLLEMKLVSTRRQLWLSDWSKK